MKKHIPFMLLVAGAVACGAAPPAGQEEPATAADAASAQAAKPLRLYVLDCGQIVLEDPEPLAFFSLSEDEVATMEAAVPCFLIQHGQETLMWDLGLSEGLGPEGETEGGITARMSTPLTAQLAELGYAPGDIDYFAMSHMHFDHSGNANLFHEVTWLARKAESDYAFSDEVEGVFGWDPSVYERLRDVDPVYMDGDHDVFGDGTVVIKPASGHTPGHQVLFIDLASYGPVVLSGDLYHFPESRELQRVPLFNHDEAQTLSAMAAVEAFLDDTGAELWIEHDSVHHATLKKAPAYYD